MNRELGDFWLYYRPGAKSWVISKGHYLGKRSFASPDDVIQIPSFDILPTFIQQFRDFRTAWTTRTEGTVRRSLIKTNFWFENVGWSEYEKVSQPRWKFQNSTLTIYERFKIRPISIKSRDLKSTTDQSHKVQSGPWRTTRSFQSMIIGLKSLKSGCKKDLSWNEKLSIYSTRWRHLFWIWKWNVVF